MIGGSSHDIRGKKRRETKLERNFFLRLKDALLLGFAIFLQHKNNSHLTAIWRFNRQFCQQLPPSLFTPYSSLCGMLAIICSILSGNYFDEGEIQSVLRDVVPNLLLRGQPCVWDARYHLFHSIWKLFWRRWDTDSLTKHFSSILLHRYSWI